MMSRLPLLLLLASFATACAQAPEPVEPSASDATPAPVEQIAAQSPVETEVPAAARDPERPRLRIDTLDHGTFDLAEQRGQWVVVNFWATWCKPCIKEIPDLSAFDAARDDVRVIGLAYEEIALDDLRAFLAKHPAGYPIAVLDVYDPPADFDTPRGLPMTYLIAPDGKVAKKFLGPITSDDLGAAITEHAATES
ncbi:MAG TPA: TlpA disulfide reductase family protein [Arenimonas sp.]|nr:TlpA disulfide reductase family protein [Arenimonas sp.]